MKRNQRITGLLCMVALLLGVTACGSAETVTDSIIEETIIESSEQGQAESESATSATETVEMATEAPSTTDETDQPQILIAYFSATGNTRPIAETIAAITGADLYEIVPVEPYTEDDLNYSNDDCRANQEQNDDSARPEISGSVENMEQYDIVLIGHPIWWGEEPRIIDTFVESYDLSGKTVVNFCTSGGSGISAATSNLKALSPDADWLDGHRFETGASEEDVQSWLTEIGLIES